MGPIEDITLYEDQSVVAFDKPAGLLTIPGRGDEKSLKELAEIVYGKLFTVHRLDRETSGVVLFSRDSQTHRYLNRLFEKREIRKEYICVIKGHVEEEFVVDMPIRTFASGRMGVDPKGKGSITRFCVLSKGSEHSLLRAYPLTGRRHQIRVHLYWKGYPIVGDPLYRWEKNKTAFRLMLHSHRIEYRDIQGRLVCIVSRVPEEFFSYVT